MATKPCQDCGEPVSSEAYNCPHCRRMTVGGVVNSVLSTEFILVMLLIICFKFLAA